jgi:hypothetical protein
MRVLLLSVFALAACGQPVEPPADPPPVQTSAASDAPELQGSALCRLVGGVGGDVRGSGLAL